MLLTQSTVKWNPWVLSSEAPPQPEETLQRERKGQAKGYLQLKLQSLKYLYFNARPEHRKNGNKSTCLQENSNKKNLKQTRKPRRGRSLKLNVLTGPEPFPDILEFLRAFSLNAFQTGSPPAKKCEQSGKGVPAQCVSHQTQGTRLWQLCMCNPG